MANILITGGLGFVGANLIPRLAKNHTIIALDHGNPAYGTELTQAREDAIRAHASVFRTDILDAETLGNLFPIGSLDLIIHLAAWPGVRASLQQQEDYFRNNVVASQRVLSLASHHKIPSIMASSSSVYGDLGQYKACAEEDASGQGLRSPYAVSKWITESWYETVATTLPPVLFVRPFTLYGPLGRPDMAYFSFARRILHGQPIRVFGSLDAQRDFTFIADAVHYLSELTEALLTNPIDTLNHFKLESGKAVVNICNGQPQRLTSLVEILASALNTKPNVEYLPRSNLDLRGTFGCPRKLHSLVEPRTTPFEAGLQEFCRWLIASEGTTE